MPVEQASDLSWTARGHQLPEARDLAGELDADHAPDPGGLRDIGTCRVCGLLIARDANGVWSHRPSVGEIDAAGAWIDRHSPPQGNDLT